MAITPPQLPNVPGPFDQPSPANIGPYSPTLPDQVGALESKYRTIAPQLQQYDPTLVNALMDLDAQRVASGSSPLSYQEADSATWKILQTARDRTPATAPAEPSLLNVPGNALRDLGDIVRSIPRLPLGLARMVQEPSQALNLIPGSYIAQNLTNPRELATHPLMTVLDVLPIAGKLASGTKVGQAAAAAASAEGRIARPLVSMLTRRIDDSGQLVPTGLARGGQFLRDETRIGQLVDTTFGQRARDVSSISEMFGKQQVKAELSGVLPTDAAGEVFRQANDLAERYGIPSERMASLTETLRLGDPNELKKITDPHELAAITEYRDELLPKLSAYQENVALDIGQFDGELYDMEQYLPLQQARASLDEATVRSKLRDAIYDTQGQVHKTEDLYTGLRDALRAPAFEPGVRDAENLTRQRLAGALSTEARNARIQGTLAALDARGIDVRPLREAIKKGTPLPGLDVLPTRPRMSYMEVTEALQRYARGPKPDIQVDRLLQAMKQGPGPALTRALSNLLDRTGPGVVPELADPVLVDSLRRMRDEARLLGTSRWRTAGQGQVMRAEEELANLQRRSVPARFEPLVNSITKEQFVRAAKEQMLPLPPERVAEVTQALLEKRWGNLAQYGLPADDLEDLFRVTRDEVAQSWQDLRAAGHEPVFVHVVTPKATSRAASPGASEVPTTITSAKRRTLDSTGGVQDFSVAISHQAAEYVSRRASEQVAEVIAGKYGIPESQLREIYAPEARAIVERDPRITFDDAMNDVVSRAYRRFNPEELGYNWGGSRLDAITQSGVWVPKAVYDNLKHLHNPQSVLGGLFDPVTRLFRISVTGLSPRIHLYNIMGGATMLAAEAGPQSLAHMRAASTLLKDPDGLARLASTDPEIARMLGGQADFFKELDLTKPSTRTRLARFARTEEAVDATRNYLLGRTMRRLFDEAGQARQAGALGKAKDGVMKAAEWSYDLNGRVDDMFRFAAYTRGKDKALRAGMSDEVARNAGMEMARRSLMDYASLTATERNVLRSIFPFYSFTRHAVSFVLRYPIDHPLRASVMAAVARGELDDADDVLPSRLFGALFVGDTDAKGGRTGLNIAPINPFGDVANMMTLQGFLGSANPVISTVLEAVGVDRGEAELYPTLRFNSETGRLDGVHRNPLVALVENTIPQATILTSVLGANKDYNRMVRTDPQGALRSLLSASGVPILWRKYNVPQEIYKAELARQASQGSAASDARLTGDWSEANRYPGLRDTFGQVAQWAQQNPQAVQQYQLGPDQRARILASIQHLGEAVDAVGSGRGPVGAVSRGI